MANNRLWAVCKDHNDCGFITKYYPSSPWDLPENPENINEFLSKHNECPSNQGCGENILFVTELDDRVEKYDFSKQGEFKIYLK